MDFPKYSKAELGTFTTLYKETGKRARFTCTEKRKIEEVNVFQDILNSIQTKNSSETNDEDRFMKGDVFNARSKFKNNHEQQMYNDIMKFCEVYKRVYVLLEIQNHCMATEGMTNVIQSILREYYKEVAEVNFEDPSKPNLENEWPRTTLRGALIWCRQPIIILEHVVGILEKTKDLKGSSIMNPLIEIMSHSNPLLSKVTSIILEGATEAFCKMSWLWLIMGILNDPYEEFFVIKNDTNSKPSSWHMKYCLRKESVPKNMSLETARLIVEAGKMLNFLQVTCSETVPFTNSRKYLSDLQQEPHCGLLPLIMPDNGLTCQIHRLFKEYETMVLIVMKEKFSLIEYFYGVYWYIFLKLSNFGRFFIELIHPLHYQQVESLRIDILKKKLKRAVIATSPYNKKKRRLQEAKCIIANWKETTPSDRLCDVLQLNYDPGGPLKSVFYVYESAYQKIFSFLWKKQHIQFSLCNQRKSLLYLMKKVTLEKSTSYCWKMVFWLVSMMMQFIYQLDYYFMYEIIEKEWSKFWNIFNKAKCIYDVTDSFGSMLNNILNGTMQTDHNKDMKLFFSFFYILIIDVEKAVDNIEKRILKTNGYLADPMKSMAEIQILRNNFEEAVKEFMKILKCFNHNEALTALSERVNFNYYYKEMD